MSSRKRKRPGVKAMAKNTGMSKRGQEKSDHQKRQLRRARQSPLFSPT